MHASLWKQLIAATGLALSIFAACEDDDSQDHPSDTLGSSNSVVSSSGSNSDSIPDSSSAANSSSDIPSSEPITNAQIRRIAGYLCEHPGGCETSISIQDSTLTVRDAEGELKFTLNGAETTAIQALLNDPNFAIEMAKLPDACGQSVDWNEFLSYVDPNGKKWNQEAAPCMQGHILRRVADDLYHLMQAHLQCPILEPDNANRDVNTDTWTTTTTSGESTSTGSTTGTTTPTDTSSTDSSSTTTTTDDRRWACIACGEPCMH